MKIMSDQLGERIARHYNRYIWLGMPLRERFLIVLGMANAIARATRRDELGWIETGDLCRLKFHTPAQRKKDLIELGHDIRCETRVSLYRPTDRPRRVYKYRIFEKAQGSLTF